MDEKGYKKLIAWQVANELVHKVYDSTTNYPKEELYCLTSQLRRAALSVAANIVEGHARVSKNEFNHFLSIALGSLAEVEYYIEFAYERKYISVEEFSLLKENHKRCGQLLWKLYLSQRARNN
jgi:four helix bundle protein